MATFDEATGSFDAALGSFDGVETQFRAPNVRRVVSVRSRGLYQKPYTYLRLVPRGPLGTTGSNQTVFVAGPADLELLTEAPTVIRHVLVAPAAGVLDLVSESPVASQVVFPSAGLVDLTGEAPTLVTGNAIIPADGMIDLVTESPVITVKNQLFGVLARTTRIIQRMPGNGLYQDRVRVYERRMILPFPILDANRLFVITPTTGLVDLTGEPPVLLADASQIFVSPAASGLVDLVGEQPGITATKIDPIRIYRTSREVRRQRVSLYRWTQQTVVHHRLEHVKSLVTESVVTVQPTSALLDLVGDVPGLIVVGSTVIPADAALMEIVTDAPSLNSVAILVQLLDAARWRRQRAARYSEENQRPWLGTRTINVFSQSLPFRIVIPADNLMEIVTEAPTLTGLRVNVQPSAGLLDLVGERPGVTDRYAQPASGTLEITVEAPTVLQSRLQGPTTSGLVEIQAEAPNVFLFASDSTIVIPVSGLVDLVGESPSLRIPFIITPSAGVLELVGSIPESQVFATPVAGLLELISTDPAVFTKIISTVNPNAGLLEILTEPFILTGVETIKTPADSAVLTIEGSVSNIVALGKWDVTSGGASSWSVTAGASVSWEQTAGSLVNWE